MERETLEFDVVFVGAGPANLSGALHLARLVKQNNKLGDVEIAVIEKGAAVGAHILSGAVMDPKALRELIPDFEAQGAPLESPVKEDYFLYLTPKLALRSPITPPPLKNHGYYIVSLNRLTAWLGEKCEEAGVNVFPEFPGADLLYDENDRVLGVRTGDKGIDKEGKPKANFEPGYELQAKVVILAEGSRGSLTKQLINGLELPKDRNPQTYGQGVKELWELPSERIAPGEVIYTMGWPLSSREYGGGWIYGGKNNVVSLGFVTGLDYPDPRLDPHHVLQQFKLHPFVAKLLEGGKMIRYGAKSLPYGGWWAVPPLAGDGWMIVGDSAGLLNSQRLKGIHLAIKSGMLAAETAFEALQKDDFSSRTLSQFQTRVETSWIKQELWKVRNFHQGFEHGFWRGMAHAGIQQFTGGRGLRERYPATPGFVRMKKISELPPDGGAESHLIGPAKGNGKQTFDKLTDLYHSGTKHEEDQPAHLIIHDTNVCESRCLTEFGSPCQHFCPANVYEMLDDPTRPQGKRISLNPSNCVHCKTCDIQDPYQIITWVPPEGGGGPNYDGM